MTTKQTFDLNNAAPVGAAQTDQPGEPVPARKSKGRAPAATRTQAETEPAAASVSAQDAENTMPRAAKAGRANETAPGTSAAPASNAGSDCQAKVAAAASEAAGPKMTAPATTKADPTSKLNRTDATKVGAAEPGTHQSRKGGGIAKNGSKTELVVKKLRLAKGVSIEQLVEATGWQAHSVRGFLSAVVRKKMSLNLTSETGKDGVRRYRIADGAVS